jgi:DNA-binding PadR family transcriptional regulator
MNSKTLCLESLSLGPRSGYDLKRLCEAVFRHFHSASLGSISPTFAQIETEVWVSAHTERKVFRLTDARQAALTEDLAGAASTAQLRSEVLVLRFFPHLLPTERLETILDTVIQRHTDTLAYLESILDLPEHTPDTRFRVQTATAPYRAMLDFLATRGPELLRAQGPTNPAEGT